MSWCFDSKTIKLKWGDIHDRVRGKQIAMIWNDKWDVHILTNIYRLPTEGNFCEKPGKDKEVVTTKDYGWQMGYVDKGERMANSDSVSQRTWKVDKNLLFHLLRLTILNSYIILSFCGNKNRPQRVLSGFGSESVGNECKEASSSVLPKRKTRPRSQSPTHWTMTSCRILLTVPRVNSQEQVNSYQIPVYQVQNQPVHSSMF
jgi:hypothetical protein